MQGFFLHVKTLLCITIPCIVWLWCQQAQDLTTLWCPWKDCWSQAAKTSAEGKLQFVSKSGVPTIYTRKTEILVDKSDGLHQSKNMGCDLRQCNFSTLCTLFSWFGYTVPYGGLFSYCINFYSFKFMHLGDSWICVHVTGKHPTDSTKRPSSQWLWISYWSQWHWNAKLSLWVHQKSLVFYTQHQASMSSIATCTRIGGSC